MHKTILFLGTVLILVPACSEDGDKSTDEHVWKEQTQTIDKANEVEGLLQGAADRQREIIDEQMQ